MHVKLGCPDFYFSLRFSFIRFCCRKEFYATFIARILTILFGIQPPQQHPPQRHQGTTSEMPKQRPQTLDSLFANMKEERMRTLSRKNNNVAQVQRNRMGAQQRPPWRRARFGNNWSARLSNWTSFDLSIFFILAILVSWIACDLWGETRGCGFRFRWSLDEASNFFFFFFEPLRAHIVYSSFTEISLCL